jgi:hypothetical protein
LAAEWLLGLDGLALLGPIHAQKWMNGAGELDAEVAAELWEIDNGPRFLELSMRVNVKQDPVRVQRRLEQTVRDHGLEISPNQQTKTSTVLNTLLAPPPASERLRGERGCMWAVKPRKA